MRAIYTKELKELALAGLPLALLAIPVGWAVGVSRIGDDLLVALLCGAGLFGIVHGVLDKFRTRETFLYHRPAARWRIELARTLAGATHVVFAAAVLLGTVRLHAALSERGEPTVLSFAQNALSVATALLVWAAVRLGFSFRRVPHILAYFLGYGVLLLPLLRRESFAAATAVASATALLCTLPVLALPRARRVALCAITAWIVLGLTALARGGTSALLAASYPFVAVDRPGDVFHVRTRRGERFPDEARHPDVAGLPEDLTFVLRPSPDWVPQPLGPTVFDRIDRTRSRSSGPRPSSDLWSWDPVSGQLIAMGADKRTVRHRIDLSGQVRFLDLDHRQSSRFLVVGTDDRVRVYDRRSGRAFLETPWEPSEEPTRFSAAHVRSDPPRLLFTTRLPGVDATRHRFRIRLVEPDGTRRHDVVLEPVSALERAIALLGGSIAVLRPPLLNAVSFAAPAAESRDAYYAWWLDVWFRGRKRFGWLLASVAVGLLCAWRARVQARVRLARGGRAWVALAVLLGPLGLIWMRIFVPWVHVEEVAGERRAVNLDGPWPEPEPTGREVLAPIAK